MAAALAPSMGLSAANAAAAPTVCGHTTKQKIGPLGEPDSKVWCGLCWATYQRLVDDLRTGMVTRNGLRAGLTTLLATFQPPLDRTAIRATVTAAITDIEDFISHAA